MNRITLILFTFCLIACNQQTNKIQVLQNQFDSLTTKLANTYKPGLNYAGTDEVEISLGISNGGAIVNTLKTKFKILIRN